MPSGWARPPPQPTETAPRCTEAAIGLSPRRRLPGPSERNSEVAHLLVPLAAVLVLVVVGALVWAVRSGQFEDLVGPATRILIEDAPKAGRSPSGGPNGETPADSGRPAGDGTSRD
ncbi:MAG: cbb3-type cytochrome oxidase assembly protein CcoS [Thermoanaerobaculia bacterium]